MEREKERERERGRERGRDRRVRRGREKREGERDESNYFIYCRGRLSLAVTIMMSVEPTGKYIIKRPIIITFSLVLFVKPQTSRMAQNSALVSN